MEKRTAVILAFAVTILWGSMCVVSNYLEQCGIISMDIAFLRLGLTSVILFFVLLIFDRESLKIKKKDLWIFPVFGFCEFISEVLIFKAMYYVPSPIAVLLQMTSPFYIMILSYFIFKEKITKPMIIAAIIAIIGCFFATMDDGSGTMNIIGILAGIGSGIGYALYVIGSKLSMDRGYSPHGTLFYLFFFGALFSIPTADLGHIAEVISVDWKAVISIIVLVVFMTLIPYYLTNVIIQVLGPTTTSILELMEIVFSSIFEYFFIGRIITGWNIFGMILIMLAIVIMNVGTVYIFKRLRENKGNGESA